MSDAIDRASAKIPVAVRDPKIVISRKLAVKLLEAMDFVVQHEQEEGVSEDSDTPSQRAELAAALGRAGHAQEYTSKKLPGWTLRLPDGNSWVALDPNYQVTGIAVHADDLDELVERVRALVAVIDVARQAIEGGRSVSSSHPGLRALPAVPAKFSPTEIGPPERTPSTIEQAKFKGYEGDSCAECGAMTMVRNGACLKCVSCGGTNGCS